VLSHCRVLHAVWHLDVLGRSNKATAAELRFPSPSALGSLIVRFTGATPRIVRQRGGFATLLDGFGRGLGVG
jgi:hypothetical protein